MALAIKPHFQQNLKVAFQGRGRGPDVHYLIKHLSGIAAGSVRRGHGRSKGPRGRKAQGQYAKKLKQSAGKIEKRRALRGWHGNPL